MPRIITSLDELPRLAEFYKAFDKKWKEERGDIDLFYHMDDKPFKQRLYRTLFKALYKVKPKL